MKGLICLAGVCGLLAWAPVARCTTPPSAGNVSVKRGPGSTSSTGTSAGAQSQTPSPSTAPAPSATDSPSAPASPPSAGTANQSSSGTTTPGSATVASSGPPSSSGGVRRGSSSHAPGIGSTSTLLTSEGTGTSSDLASSSGYVPEPLNRNLTRLTPPPRPQPKPRHPAHGGKTSSVPDTAATASLLGMGLCGTILMKKKMGR